MYIDNDLLVSNAQAITADAYSTYSIDLKAARKVWGGKQLYMIVTVDETFATKTDVDFQVVSATSATDLSAGKIILASTGAIAIGSLTIGRAPIIIPIGSNVGTEQQYLGMYYLVGGTETGAGKVSAFVAFDAPSNP